MARQLIRTLLTTSLAATVLNLQAGVTPANLYSFTNGFDGAYPYAGLAQGSDGNFYGTAYAGGSNGWGTCFRVSTNGALKSLYSFGGGNDGGNPQAGLAEGTDGNFYGTTSYGGTALEGTVFKVTTNGALTSLYSFTNGSDGADPCGGLVLGSDGNFYGTTYSGGGTNLQVVGFGTVFKVSPAGAITILYSFTGGADGANPQAGLVQGWDGSFYGTTAYGGRTNSAGTVFKINTNGALTTLHSFTGGLDGANPAAGLVQASDGTFYGTAYAGGSNGWGTVFRASSSGAFISLYSFTGARDGAGPIGLIQGSDGNFYGTTYGGGTNEYGTVFKYTAYEALTTLYSFSGGNDGGNPQGAPVEGRDGNLYGTTFGGGSDGYGVAFRLSVGLPDSDAVWIPVDSAFGFSHGVFGFHVAGPAGSFVVIQSSANLETWVSLQTNLMGSGWLYFSDPQPPAIRRRFYRAILP